MGWFSDSSENTANSPVENVITVNEKLDTLNEDMQYALYMIVLILALGMLFKLFQVYNKQLKKRYTARENQQINYRVQ